MTEPMTHAIGWLHEDEGITIVILGPTPQPREKPQDKWNRMRLDNEWCAKLVSIAPGPIVEL